MELVLGSLTEKRRREISATFQINWMYNILILLTSLNNKHGYHVHALFFLLLW